MVSGTYLLVNGIVLALFISLCVHHEAFFDIFNHLVSECDYRDVNRRNESFLCNLVRFHVTIKQWVQHTKRLRFTKIILNSFKTTRSWFALTARVYSPFVMVQLVYLMFLMSIAVFFINMVCGSCDNSCFICEHSSKYFILATSKSWLQFVRCFGLHFQSFDEHVSLLLLCKISNWKLWENVTLLISLGLAKVSGKVAKISHYYDRQHADTNLLPRIRCYQLGFDDIHCCENSNKLLIFQVLKRWIQCLFQLIRKVSAFFMMFQTIASN